MEVRVCPKCGTENKRYNATCTSCFTSLARVPVTQGGAGQPVAQVPAGAAPTQGIPQYAPQGTQPHQQSYQQPYQQQYQQPYQPVPEGKKATSMVPVFVIMGVLILIGIACLVPGILSAIRQHRKPTGPADKFVMQFLEAKKTGDLSKVKPYLSKESITMIENTLGGRQARSAGFDEKYVANMLLFDTEPTSKSLRKYNLKCSIDKSSDEEKSEDKVVVVASLTEKQQTPPVGQNQQGESAQMVDFDDTSGDYQIVVVNEEGSWKVDVASTNDINGSSLMNRLLPGK